MKEFVVVNARKSLRNDVLCFKMTLKMVILKKNNLLRDIFLIRIKKIVYTKNIVMVVNYNT